MSSAYAAAQAGQRQAADPRASVFVTANAGSGKTKVLIDRVARLLLAGGSPSAFLCITYTKAAAAEMQRRLFARLGEWCVKDDDALALELSTLMGADAPALSQRELARARALFARALETPGGLRIQTIHAFCERLLKRFPLESGVQPGFEIADERMAETLIGSAWAAAAATAPTDSALARFAELLDHERLRKLRDAVAAQRSAFLGHLRDAAGLDAVRTHVRARHGATCERDAVAQTFLAATPWGDLEAACAQLLASGKADQECAARLAIARDGGIEAYFDVFLTQEGLPRANVVTKRLRQAAPSLGRLFADEQRRVSEARAALKAIDRAEDVAALLTLADGLLEAYAHAKRRIGALDFDDLIERAHALLARADAAPWVLYKLDYGIEHILIDEGQDTSPAQWRLIEPLQAEFFAGEGARATSRTVFAVGDPKQSIYSFQGADPDRFLQEAQRLAQRAVEAERDFAAPQLSMSFRSTQTILDAVDRTFEDLSFAAREPESSVVARHVARREGEIGLVEWWPLAPRPERNEPRVWDAPLDIEQGVTAAGVLARAIAQRVKVWIDNGEAIWDPKNGRLRPLRPGDVFALVRKRGPVFDELLRAFRAAGLEVAGADRMNLREELAVEDLLAFVRVALDPGDDLSLACALKSPFIGLDDDDLIALAAGRGPGDRVIDNLRRSQAPAHRRAAAEIDRAIALAGAHPYEFLTRLLETPDESGASGWARLYARLGAPARDPVEELLGRAQTIGESGAPTLQRLLTAIEGSDTPIKREMESGGDAVRVMTVHGAKGLEAPLVILADSTGRFESRDETGLIFGEDGVFWSPNKASDDDATAAARAVAAEAAYREHLRLLYVAMTRARDRLIVCGPAFGNARSGRADRCWHELVEQGLVRAGAHTCETPFGKGLQLGETKRCESARASVAPAVRIPPWAREMAEPEAGAPLSPSRLHDGEPPALPVGAAGLHRFRRGRLIHGLLQRLPDVAPAARRAAATAWLKTQKVAPEESEALVSEATAVLDDPGFAAAFGPMSRAEAPIVGALPNGQSISGVIDRLLVRDDEILAIDFKTDRPPPRDAGAIPQGYVNQMAAYAVCLSGAFPGRPVRCALLWTEAPRLMAIPGERVEAAIAALG
jgi:ATP-dependent helicase/nuclease subunit A